MNSLSVDCNDNKKIECIKSSLVIIQNNNNVNNIKNEINNSNNNLKQIFETKQSSIINECNNYALYANNKKFSIENNEQNGQKINKSNNLNIKKEDDNNQVKNENSEETNDLNKKSAIDRKRKISAFSLKNGAWEENEEIISDKIKREIIEKKYIKNKSKSLINNLRIFIKEERNKTWAIVFLLGTAILSMVICSNFIEKDSKTKEGDHYRIQFRQTDIRVFDLLDENGDIVLTLYYGVNIPKDIKPIKCTKLSKSGKISYLCRDWLYRASLSIGIVGKQNKINCYNIEWKSYTSKEVLKDCIDLKNGYWFGMGHLLNSPWPLNDWSQKMAPFVTSANLNNETPFGSIIRRYWLSSEAISISVPLDIPLHVNFNETINGKATNQMCFESNLMNYPYEAETSVKLEYSICTGNDVKKVHTESSKEWLQSSGSFDLSKSPEIAFINKPIWSTLHLPELNQSELHKFTKNINDITNITGFLLIDTRWESQLGELIINQTKFSAPLDTFKSIANRGWKIILMITPLINIVANMLIEASYHKRILLDRSLQVPLLTKCSPEENLKFCAVLDILKPLNREWFKKRLVENIINKYNIEALMFQGIEVSRMPQYHHNQLHNVINPDYYQVYYIDIAASTAKYIGMTTAAGIKDVQGFLLIPPLENTWKALNLIIPLVLNLGLVGFSLINTGSVGGDIIVHPKDDELYVRWLELSLFLPIVQFSKVEDINSLHINNIKTLKKYQNIRKTDLLSIMAKCISENNQNGWPIIRPLWWLEPDDISLYTIKDQFSIGDEIIVAPILNKGQTKRNITLPNGIWQDMITLKNEKGGKTLQNYEVDLNQIPYFKRVKNIY